MGDFSSPKTLTAQDENLQHYKPRSEWSEWHNEPYSRIEPIKVFSFKINLMFCVAEEPTICSLVRFWCGSLR